MLRRRPHAATQARLEEVRRQLDEAPRQFALVEAGLGEEVERESAG